MRTPKKNTTIQVPKIVLPIVRSERSIIGTLADNACGCIQNDINKALSDLSTKATKAASKLTDAITGPLNNPIDLINDEVLEAQNALATGFEDQLKGAVQDLVDSTVGTTLNTSCFLAPFADFKDQLDANIDFLGGLIQGMDFRIPTLNLNFQIAMAVNICGAADTFSGPLASILASAGLGANGAFDITGAFSGMIFPTTSYEEAFKQTIGSVVNVGNMQNMMDSVVSSINDRIDSVTGAIDAGISAVTNWTTETAKTVNELAATISDPSKAIAEITNRIPVPGAVAWAAQFAGVFGFAVPGIGGGGSPKRPKDVNYLTNKIQGDRINTLLALHENHANNAEFYKGIDDSITGFTGLSDIGTEEGLGRQLKGVMGMTDSPLSDAEFSRQVKAVAGDMSVEGQAAAAQRTLPEAIQHVQATTGTQAEINQALTLTNYNIASSEASIAATQAAADELRASGNLTPEETSYLARADKTIAETQASVDKAYLQQAALQSALRPQSDGLPGSTDERLSNLYTVPPTDLRYGRFTDIPGDAPRIEQTTTLGQTVQANNEGRQAADVAFAARLNAASGRTPEEIAEADRNFEARLNERRGTLPPTNDTRLSNLTPTPVTDSTLAARASSQPGSDAVLANTSLSQPANNTAQFGRREQGYQPSPGELPPQASSEYTSRELPPEAPGRREGGFRPPSPETLQESPGSAAAQSYRSNIPNSQEVLTERSTTAVEAAAATPPVWLSNFNENFNNQ